MLRTGLFSWYFESKDFKAGLKVDKLEDNTTTYRVEYTNRQLRIYNMRMVFETIPDVPCIEKTPHETYNQIVAFMYELVMMSCDDLAPLYKNITPEGK